MANSTQAAVARWEALKGMIEQLARLGYVVINGELPGVQPAPLGVQSGPLAAPAPSPIGPAVRAYYGVAPTLIAEIRFEPVTYVAAIEQAVEACFKHARQHLASARIQKAA